MPGVSIIVPFLDPPPPYFEQAIDSVLAQTYTDWELILVDDGSGAEARGIAERHASADPERVHIVDSAARRPAGISAARNAGIAEARANYLALLDADDVYLPQRLERHLAALEEAPTAAMVFSDTLYWFKWAERPEKGDEVRRAGVRPGVVPPPVLLARILRGRAEVPCTSSVTLRASAVATVGGYEPEWRGLYDDQVFYTKILSHFPVRYLPGVLAYYRRNLSSITQSTSNEESLRVRADWLAWVSEYVRIEVPEEHRPALVAACDIAARHLRSPIRRTLNRIAWKAWHRIGARW